MKQTRKEESLFKEGTAIAGEELKAGDPIIISKSGKAIKWKINGKKKNDKH